MSKRQLLEQFIIENMDSAYRFAYSYTKDKEEAEDVVGESVLKALKSIGQLRDVTRMKSWFFRIIINSANESHRSRSKICVMGEEELENLIPPSLPEPIKDFESMTNILPVELRNIIVLRFLEDMKIRDIAELLDTNENTVKTRLYKALRMLRLEMEDNRDAERS
jgi:RNA polymerase sigma-70 factor (ECF subfamily)